VSASLTSPGKYETIEVELDHPRQERGPNEAGRNRLVPLRGDAPSSFHDLFELPDDAAAAIVDISAVTGHVGR
jgi:hypothetical protein